MKKLTELIAECRYYEPANLREGGYMASGTSNRGFAAMDEAKQKEIASKGGKATGGKNLSTEARAKGGRNSRGGGRKS